MENEVLFLIPFGFFGLISIYCFYSMMSITAIEFKDDGKFFGLKSWDFISDFQMYTDQLTDKKKKRKHRILYWGFFISLIFMMISMFAPLVLSLVIDLFNEIF